jgi:hypothetical protein
MRLAGSLLSLAALAVVPAARAQFANVDACTLLTASETGTAMGVKANDGQHLVEPSKGECVWTDGAKDDLGHRRVALSIMSILNGLKVKPPLSADAVKAGEIALGKKAAGRA